MDSATGLILKREVLDNVGARTGSFEFTQISYDPAIRSGDFAIQVKGATRVTLLDKVRQIASRSGLNPVVLSDNRFTFEGVNVVRPQGIVVLHESYLGPRGRLSLFEVSGSTDLRNIRPPNTREFDMHLCDADKHRCGRCLGG